MRLRRKRREKKERGKKERGKKKREKERKKDSIFFGYDRSESLKSDFFSKDNR